jgi:hypothetical protein
MVFPPPGTETHQTRFFRFLVPPGWRLADEGQFAIALVAPDSCAVTVLTGNAGLPPWTHPLQFLGERLAQGGATAIQLGPPRPAPPIAGFAQAIECDYVYLIGSVPCQGLASVSISPGPILTMAACWAASTSQQWPAYAPWLPSVARSVVVIDGAAFGLRAVVQQDRADTVAFGEAVRQQLEHVQVQWDGVTRDRWASQDHQHAAFRDNLAASRVYTNPYGYPEATLSSQYAYYWIDRLGRIVGTNDPSHDPNVGAPGDWTRMTPIR